MVSTAIPASWEAILGSPLVMVDTGASIGNLMAKLVASALLRARKRQPAVVTVNHERRELLKKSLKYPCVSKYLFP